MVEEHKQMNPTPQPPSSNSTILSSCAPATTIPEATSPDAFDIMLDSILGPDTDSMQQISDSLDDDISQACSNELSMLEMGGDFKMRIRKADKSGFNCPLDWWRSNWGRYKRLSKLAIKFLSIPATSAPSERVWSRAARVLTAKRSRMKQDATQAMMYCRENTHLLHKYYCDIAKKKMHESDHWAIPELKRHLPTFINDEDENDVSKIDVGGNESLML